MNNTLKYYRSKRDRLQLRYGNRLYNLRGRKQNEFVCGTDKCYASLFLVLILVGGEHVIAEPLELLSYNGSHKEHCIEKPFILIIYPVNYYFFFINVIFDNRKFHE